MAINNDLMRRIEEERFSSLNDPGIHVIKLRLRNLEFITGIFPECCSGHPYEETFTDVETNLEEKVISGEDGYIIISYDPNSEASAKFHDQLVGLKVHKGSYSVLVTSSDPFCVKEAGAQSDGIILYHQTSKVLPFEQLRNRHRSGNEVSIPLTIKIDGSVMNGNPYEVAVALCDFWQKVSDLIAGFEKTPIKEVLQPYYFGLRSRYGKIESVHPIFNQYITQSSTTQKIS